MTASHAPVKRMTYTLPEAAIMLGINRTTAYKMAASGEFPVPVIHVGKAVRIPAQPLDALLSGEIQTQTDKLIEA